MEAHKEQNKMVRKKRGLEVHSCHLLCQTNLTSFLVYLCHKENLSWFSSKKVITLIGLPLAFQVLVHILFICNIHLSAMSGRMVSSMSLASCIEAQQMMLYKY